jgi:hypothetical protein
MPIPGSKETKVMGTKLIALSALAAALAMVPAAAQTSAELMQKGIHLQETNGDADGAIQIYRQVIASPGAAQPLAAQAQARIVGALLQKGDLANAGQEFGKLARDYADQEQLVNSLGQQLRETAKNGPTLLLGDFRDGKYRHYRTGVELTIPPEWSFKTQKPDEGDWDRVDFAASNSMAASAFVVMQPDPTPPERIAARLLERYQYKTAVQRRATRGYLEYHVRPESVQRRTVGGKQAWSAVADYTDAAGEKMSEYLVLVHSEKNMVFFSVAASTPGFASVQRRFEPVLLTAQVP